MNSLCINFLFYLFLSGGFLFTILGLFAGSGNPALLIENQRLDENNEPIDESGLKKRVTIQYFIAAFLDLCFAAIFLRFIFNQNKSSKMIEIQQNHSETKKELIKNEDEKESNINSYSINNDEINTNGDKGMLENE